MRSRLTRAALMLIALLAVGAIGYRMIDGAGWWDSFYMTVITLTTVGYGEVFPLSQAGQAFTVALLLLGLGLFFYLATELGRLVIGLELRQLVGRGRRSRMIERLTDHEIVCGWGRMGKSVVSELRRVGRDVVVIESDPDKIAVLEERGIPVVAGDATLEETLKQARVDRARGLVACLNDDAHNVYTVLTARSLNEGLFIVARVGTEGSEQRVRRAGANRVVNPYDLGGRRLAMLLVKPTVVEFLDFSLGPAGDVALELEQVRLRAGNPLIGSTLAGAELRRRSGIGVVAVRRGDALFPNPEASLRLEEDDVLVVLGTRPQLATFEQISTSGIVDREPEA